jgi:Protein of unknown function (DUF2817)
MAGLTVNFVILTAIIAFAIYKWLDWSKTNSSNERCLSSSNGFNFINMSTFSLDKSNIDLSYECLFSSNFHEAKELFKESGKRVKGAQLLRLPVSESDTTLSNDVVVIPGSKSKYLIHISGTHGAEGYAGSAIQSAALQYLSDIFNDFTDDEISSLKNSIPTIVFVHALNPYGFANNRRVNEDNIDLNRNFLNEQEFQSVRNRHPNFAGYVDIDDYINPTTQLYKNLFLNDLNGYIITAKAVLSHGMIKIKKGLLSGNYFKPKGLGFGGFKLSKSGQNLVRLMNQLDIHGTAENVVLIDVHTGLGPSGQDTLMIGMKGYSDNEKARIRNIFPEDIDSRNGKFYGGIMENFSGDKLTGSSAGYELTVVSHKYFHRIY